MSNNQQNQSAIDIVGIVFEKISHDGAFDNVDNNELYALLNTLPRETHLLIDAAINEYTVRLAEYAFLIGWQLAKQ